MGVADLEQGRRLAKVYLQRILFRQAKASPWGRSMRVGGVPGMMYSRPSPEGGQRQVEGWRGS